MNTRNVQRNEVILGLRKEGVEPCVIARRMELSRNVVLGVLNRAGLCAPSLKGDPGIAARNAEIDRLWRAGLEPHEIAARMPGVGVGVARHVVHCSDLKRPMTPERWRDINMSPGVRARRGAAIAAAHARPEIKAGKSAAMRKLWADPEFRARMAALRRTPEYREACRAGQLRRLAQHEASQ